MGIGIWTTVEGNVYPSTTRYSGGFQWMVVDNDRTTSNESTLRIRPYIKKLISVSNTYAAYNLAYQTSYFTLNDADKKTLNTAFDFKKADVGTEYPLASSYPFKTDADLPYVEYVVKHDANGMATVKIGGYIKGEASSSHFQYVKTTQTVTLPQINRASKISAQGDIDIGSDVTLYISKANDEYVNTIQFSCNGSKGNIAVETSAASVVWSVPTSLNYAVPDTSDRTACTIICTTYDKDGNQIGTSTELTVTLHVAVKPTFDVSATIDKETLIYGISSVTITVTNAKATPGAKDNVTIITTDGEIRKTTNPAVFEKATKNVYTVWVTDSRGLAAEKTVEISTTSPYVPPSVGSVNLQRDVENGNVTISVSGKWTSGVIDGSNQNEFMILQVEAYERGSEENLNVDQFFIYSDSPESPASVKEYHEQYTLSGFELNKAYTLLIYPLDIFYSVDDPAFPAVPFQVIVPRAVPPFMWNEETFRVNGNLEVTGTYPGGGSGGSYTAGTGLNISADGVISVETTSDAIQNDDRPVSSGALYAMLKQINDVLGGI